MIANPREPSQQIQAEDVPGILKRISHGEFLNRIAADYDVNPGRISEIKNRYRYSDITGIKPVYQTDMFDYLRKSK